MVDIWIKTKSFTIKCRRVWYSLKKPSKKEYAITAKVSGVGILILGILGFLISTVMKAFI